MPDTQLIDEAELVRIEAAIAEYPDSATVFTSAPAMAATIRGLWAERDGRIAEVEHWVNRYNQLEAWRVQTAQRLAEVEAERDAARDEVERADAEIVERAAQLSAQVVIDGAIAAVRDKCVEKVRARAGSRLKEAAEVVKDDYGYSRALECAGGQLEEVAKELESLTLEPVEK